MATKEEQQTEWLGFRCTKEIKESLINYRSVHGSIATSATIRKCIVDCPIFENILLQIVPILNEKQKKILLNGTLEFKERKTFLSLLNQ